MDHLIDSVTFQRSRLRSRRPQAIPPTSAMVAQIPAVFSIIPSLCLLSAAVTASAQAVPADSLAFWNLWLIAAVSVRHVASSIWPAC